MDCGGEALERLDVGFVVALVLGAGSGDEVIESLHLDGHIFHLGVDNADGLFVDRFCGCLDGGIVLIDRSPILLHLALEGISRLEYFFDN